MLGGLLFKGSPVLPTGKSVHAESGYRFGGPALYAESVDVYDKALKTREVVSDDFAAVSQCHGDAVGVAPSGSFGRCGSVSSAQRTMAFWYGP